MREQISAALKEAMKARRPELVSTLRLMLAAIKDREISLRTDGRPMAEEDILQILQKMVRQRQESADTYTKAGRKDLADQENGEISIIESFLPAQLADSDIHEICARTIADIGASGLKDMGRTMTALKERFAGQMDFKKASTAVRQLLH